TTNLLKFMRASIKMIGVSNLQSFIASMTQKLTLSDISDESKNYLDKAGITTACLRIKSKCPQLRDENAHNDKSVHGVLNPTYQAGLRRDAVQPDIEAERKKRDEIEAGKSYCSRRFGGATCDDK